MLKDKYCPKCKKNSLNKDGTRKTKKRGKVQQYKCMNSECGWSGNEHLTLDKGMDTGLHHDPEEIKSDKKIITDFSEDSGTVTVKSLNVKTQTDALREAEIDTKIWEVDRCIINSWEVTMGKNKTHSGEPETYTNWQVKLFLKKKTQDSIEVALKSLIKDIPKFKFPLYIPQNKRLSTKSANLLEIAPLDAHFAKLAWDEEVGRSYDLKVAIKDYIAAVTQLLDWSQSFKPEKIIYIVGQDLLHVESFVPITFKAHNVLDTDSRYPKIYKAAKETVIKCVYACRSVAPTEVIWIPGNHDEHASFAICDAIGEHFREDEHVTVDVSPMQRKARLWGNFLCGFTHQITGKENSWANELAQAFPNLWGKSKFREWHSGHQHKKKETKTFPTMTHGGVLMRQLTALSPIDAWHFEHLFTDAVPGGEGFVWNKKQGVISNLIAWTM